MPLKSYLPHKFTHQHEALAFDTLTKNLITRLKNEPEDIFLFGNLSINGAEFDALVIKEDAICVIDFKNYGGRINFSENGEWFADDILVKGGGIRRIRLDN